MIDTTKPKPKHTCNDTQLISCDACEWELKQTLETSRLHYKRKDIIDELIKEFDPVWVTVLSFITVGQEEPTQEILEKLIGILEKVGKLKSDPIFKQYNP